MVIILYQISRRLQVQSLGTRRGVGLHEEMNMALSGSTTREIEDPLGSSLMSKYKELKLEYHNLRRENRQLGARLEASERRIDVLSNRFLDQMEELENKTHAEASEQVRSLRNVYEICFQILSKNSRE